MSRSYDQWKLEAPEYNDEVTSCCGADEHRTMIDEQFEYDERLRDRYCH